jgi:hypothetical protein
MVRTLLEARKSIGSREELAHAIAEAQRNTVGGFGWAVSPEMAAQLWLHRARKKAGLQCLVRDTGDRQRAVVPVSRDIVADPIPEYPSAIPEAPTAPDVPVWQALLDVQVWRPRPWWWRLAASLVVKRLSR